MSFAGVGFEGFPNGELDDGEGNFAEDGNAPAAVELADDAQRTTGGIRLGVTQSEDGAQRGQRGAAVLACLGALLDDFGGDADGACCDFAEGGGEHVVYCMAAIAIAISGSVYCVCSSPSYIGAKGLCGFVGAKEKGCARGGA